MGQWGYERQHDALEVDGEAEAEFRRDVEGTAGPVDDHWTGGSRCCPSSTPISRAPSPGCSFSPTIWVGRVSGPWRSSVCAGGSTRCCTCSPDTADAEYLTQLATDLGAAPNTLSERLDVLEKRDLVARKSAVRRSSAEGEGEGEGGDQIELTDEGHATWLAAIEAAGEEERRLFGTLDWHEQRLLSSLLRQIMLATEAYE